MNGVRRVAALLCALHLAGCGPVLAALGIGEASKNDPVPPVVPTVSIAEAPGPVSATSISSFRFASTKPGAGFEVSVDGAEPFPSGSSLELELEDGVHTLEVTAADSSGRSQPEAYAWRIDTVPPPPPGGLRVMAVGPDRVQLGWIAAVDPDPGSGTATYLLTYAGSADALVDGVPIATGDPIGNRASVTLTNLPPCRSHEFRLSTRDGAGHVSAETDPVRTRTRCAALGTFIADPARIAASGPPHALVAGDFDNDGHEDLAWIETERVSWVRSRGDGTFDAVASESVGQGPRTLAIVDLDRDGRQDLVTARSILRGVDGGFGPAVSYPAPSNGYQVTTEDYNADGFDDFFLLAGTPVGRLIDSLLIEPKGRVDGTVSRNFIDTTLFPIASVTSADMDRDGAGDLIISQAESAEVIVRFGPLMPARQVVVPTGDLPGPVAAADFDGDGVPDLAVGTLGGTGTVRILIADATDGRSHGAASTFEQSEILTLASPPSAILARDLNADGAADVAVVSRNSDTLAIFLGLGDGRFRAAANHATGRGPNALVAVDLDDDGILDLAVSNGSSNDISLFFGEGVVGRGDGTFLVADSLPTGNKPVRITQGDFNADGRPDLAAILEDESLPAAVVAVFQARGFDPVAPALFSNAVTYSLGEFDPSETSQSAFGPATDIDAADIDRDGIMDLIVSRGTFTVESSPIHTFLGLGSDGRGNGFFGPRRAGPFSYVPIVADQLVEDFDNDGILDIIHIEGSLPFAGESGRGLAPRMNRGGGSGRFGDGTFLAAGSTWGGDRCDALRRGIAGDLDGDGRIDLVVLSEFCYEVQAARQVSGGVFELVDPARIHRTGETEPFPFDGPRALALADLDRDLVPDLIVADGTKVRTFLGMRSFQPEFVFAGEVEMGRSPLSVVVGDFNYDRIPDVATANSGDRGASVLLGEGDGTLGDATHYDIGGEGFHILTGDYNEDHVLDLAVAQLGARSIRILLGRNVLE